jgi:hypothetical protein
MTTGDADDGAPKGYGQFLAPDQSEPHSRPGYRAVGVPGLIVTAIGAVLVLVAFIGLKWFRDGSGNPVFQNIGSDSKFGNIADSFDEVKRQLADTQNGGLAKYIHFGIADSYFGWLGWALLVVVLVAALLAVTPTASSIGLRAIGVVLGIGAAALTVWALKIVTVSGPIAAQLGGNAPTWGDYVKQSGVGAWLAIGGFVLMAIGAALGTRSGS